MSIHDRMLVYPPLYLPWLIAVLLLCMIGGMAILFWHTGKRRWLIGALVVAYGACAAQWHEEVYVGVYLDEHPSALSSMSGWFREDWPYVFLVTIVIILAIHIALLIAKPKPKTKGNPSSPAA